MSFFAFPIRLLLHHSTSFTPTFQDHPRLATFAFEIDLDDASMTTLLKNNLTTWLTILLSPIHLRLLSSIILNVAKGVHISLKEFLTQREKVEETN